MPGTAGPATRWWRNCYRLSDPIGGPVSGAVDSSCVDTSDDGRAATDVLFLDPVFARSPGDPCSPPTFGHSNYFDDSKFAVTIQALRGEAEPEM
jgi:hypothetical protein